MNKKLLSIVTPCFNEEESIENCYLQVKKIISKLENITYEHIFSDNSSTDQTVEILEKIAYGDSNIKVLVNSHNVGPFKNNFNALQYAKGDYILVFLPADLQDPPELIPQMIKEIENGNEIVLGIRKTRVENIFLKLFRRIFYNLMNFFSDHKVPIGAGEFMMITKNVHKIIKESDNFNPYIRGLIAQLNYQKAHVNYTWKKREFGKSKNSFSDLINQALNALVMMAFKPVRFFVYFGFFSIFIGLMLLIATFLNYDLSFINFGLLSFIYLSIILFSIGLSGEYILSVNNKVNENLKLQVVKKINIDEK